MMQEEIGVVTTSAARQYLLEFGQRISVHRMGSDRRSTPILRSIAFNGGECRCMSVILGERGALGKGAI